MQVRKLQLELDMEQKTGSKQEKEYVKAVYCHPAYAGLDEARAGIKIAGRNTNNLRYADDTTLNSRKWRGTKQPLDEGERKADLKLNIQETKIWHLVPSLYGK